MAATWNEQTEKALSVGLIRTGSRHVTEVHRPSLGQFARQGWHVVVLAPLQAEPVDVLRAVRAQLTDEEMCELARLLGFGR